MSMSRPHLRYKKQTRRERTLTIHLISIEKTIKAMVLIVVGLKLLTLVDQDIHAWASDFVTRHGIDVGNRIVHAALQRLVGVTSGQMITFGVVALVYSVILLVEATGLWLQKRWAEYLTAVSTALLLPLELYEIYERFTWVRVAIFVINTFIVWYLATRLRDEKVEDREPGPTGAGTPRVKICGITNLTDAKNAVDSGADEIGFNFYEKSARYIPPEAAREIANDLNSSVTKVGVFVNETKERILEVADFVGLDAIQLHGDETNDFIQNLRQLSERYVIKAARIKVGETLGQYSGAPVDAILLDSFSPNEYGGSGNTFDWELADELGSLNCDTYVAGGLTPDNVAEAVQLFRPYAVDVASGVESSPGKKDHEKVAAFIKAAKEAI